MFLNSKEDLLAAVANNAKVRYLKSGSRHGWEGNLISFNEKTNKVTIRYHEQCFDQTYHISALVQDTGGYGAYIEVTSKFKEKSEVLKQRVDEFVVTNAKGEILDFSGTEEEALSFASEQVVDTYGHSCFYVFKKEFTVQSERAKPVVLTSYGEVVDESND